ncbi:hypothetical protein ID866_5354 [Astraeus odoratus]|nr:hypothetical protein ID866_5354 [Astraeus odoratus]
MKLTPFVTLGLGLTQVSRIATAVFQPGQIRNMVIFGDSYTESMYYPSADGGYAWPVYAAWYGSFDLYNFARGGATCSNNLTYHPYPSLLEYELPDYLSSMQNGTIPKSSIPTDETVYVIWIGTNDIGVLLGLDASKGVSIVDVRECVVGVVNILYKIGARNFVVMNIIPLNLAPLYAPDSYVNQGEDETERSILVNKLARSGNALTDRMLREQSLPGAHIVSFNAYGLFTDIYTNPNAYLNGTKTIRDSGGITTVHVYNVTGSILTCVHKPNEEQGPLVCTITADGAERDGYMWYDSLHPSEQVDRIVAKEITAVLKGEWSRWATWLS